MNHPPERSDDHEALRIAAVRRYDVLDTPPDGAFERITRLAAKQFDVPISIVSIVDTDRIWFKSHHGVDAKEIGRDPGLCASAILGDEPWVVEDAQADPRTMANPLVAGELGLGFYAGAPLTTVDGFNLGTLCVIDHKPREFSSEQSDMLTELAAVVMDELELRLAARQTVSHELTLREQAERMAGALQQSLLPPELPEIGGAEVAALYQPADAGVVGGDFYDGFGGAEACVLVVGDVSGKGPEAAAVTGLARHTIRAAALWANSPSQVLSTLNRAMLLGRTGEGLERFCTVLLVYIDRVEGRLACRIASAGHPPALLLSGDGSVREVRSNGLPAGLYPDADFDEVAADLAPGDRLVLFTDGLTEARTPEGMLGIEGLAAGIATTTPRSAAQTIKDLADLIGSEDVEVRDDVAALVLRVL